MATPKAPRIVAELGRPETADETAARKAANSRAHRSNQTLRNLVFALLASLAIVLFLVLVVVRPDGATRAPVDYRAIASQSQPTIDGTLAVPDLPKGWTANAARIGTGADGIQTWSIGFITPKNEYIGFEQGIKADRSWIAAQLNQGRSTGVASIAGIDWLVYDRRTTADPGNFAYSLSGVIDTNAYVLHGSASTQEFEILAKAVANG